jgi:hypothetical protein
MVAGWGRAMTTTLLDIYVPGTPRPKGSLKSYGHGRMVEQLEGSPDWRAAVAEFAYRHVAQPDLAHGGGHLADGFPHTGPVVARIALYFARPKSAKRDAQPSTIRTGDIDKQARNILDALQDGSVIKNDAQVVRMVITKAYCTPGMAPGAHIRVTTATEGVAA